MHWLIRLITYAPCSSCAHVQTLIDCDTTGWSVLAFAAFIPCRSQHTTAHSASALLLPDTQPPAAAGAGQLHSRTAACQLIRSSGPEPVRQQRASPAHTMQQDAVHTDCEQTGSCTGILQTCLSGWTGAPPDTSSNPPRPATTHPARARSHHELCAACACAAAACHNHGCLVAAADGVPALVALELPGGPEDLGHIRSTLQQAAGDRVARGSA